MSENAQVNPVEVIKAQRAEVLAHIETLERRIAQLNAALQQDNANLLASRGAVIGFDRLLEQLSPQPATPPAASE